MLTLARAFALCALFGRLRYQLLAVALAIGAAVAIVTSQSRGSVVSAVIVVVAFRIMSGIAVAGVVRFVVINSFVSDQGSTAFRYKGLGPANLLETTNGARRGGPFEAVNYTIGHFPLGAGLAVAGPAASQPDGSVYTNTLNARSEFSFLVL